MSRSSITPQDYGIDMEAADFMDLMAERFSDYTRGQASLDDMLLHPTEASIFCKSVRSCTGFKDLPDSVILKSVMIRRKSSR